MDYHSLNMRYVEQKIYDAYSYLSSQIVKDNNVIIFDIDDTLLFPDTGQIIEPVFRFYNIIKKLGIKPVIITARVATEDNIKHTQNQLKNLGITDYIKLFFRPENKYDISYYKLISRKSVVDDGYNVIMSIGDMYWDVGEYGGYPVLIKKDPPHFQFPL
jgi:predicted secreted acid phosphatase